MEFLPYSSFTQTFFTHYDFLHTHWINDSQSEIFKCVHGISDLNLDTHNTPEKAKLTER